MPFIIAFLIICPRLLYGEESFDQFIAELRAEAVEAGLTSVAVDTTLAQLSINPKILQLYHRQPEQAQTLKAYLTRRVSPQRVKRGKALLGEHSELLDAVAVRYGVQPRFIVALWGSESDYGGYMGGFSVVRSLATLAYGSKRRDYFRRELLVALRILDRGEIDPGNMVGSWAGAMGQCQFMPWSYQQRAVDFDGDGRRDIWQSQPDVFASIAHYLSAAGWRDDLTWGRPVTLDTNSAIQYANQTKSLPQWHSLGVRRLNGSDLPFRDIEAKLIRPQNGQGQTFLVYGNYDVLLKWNRSHSFAISVGTLADRIQQ